MAKDFIREGGVVAFRQVNYPDWWTLLTSDESGRTIHIYTGATWGNDSDTSPNLDNLIKVLKEIKKEVSK